MEFTGDSFVIPDSLFREVARQARYLGVGLDAGVQSIAEDTKDCGVDSGINGVHLAEWLRIFVPGVVIWL